MTGPRINPVPKQAEVNQVKITEEDRREPRLFERISNFLIEALRGSGG